MAIVQGSAFDLPIKILDGYGNDIDIEIIETVEFCIGDLRKLYKFDNSGDVSYNAGEKYFSIPLAEEETFSMKGAIQYQFRIKYRNGKIDASIPQSIEVISSMQAVKPLGE